MTAREDLFKALEPAGALYLGTICHDQAKVRPIGFRMLVDDQIYFLTGKFKCLYKQMKAHPKVEFVATVDGKIIRYYGTVVFDDDSKLIEKAYETMPMLRDMYENTDLEPVVFHLENATAEYRSMMDLEEKVKF
jgi:uncharacterized pyridoxamine 5'-phosphate oxidase family protein